MARADLLLELVRAGARGEQLIEDASEGGS
jgi:hypothetical protein